MVTMPTGNGSRQPVSSLQASVYDSSRDGKRFDASCVDRPLCLIAMLGAIAARPANAAQRSQWLAEKRLRSGGGRTWIP